MGLPKSSRNNESLELYSLKSAFWCASGHDLCFQGLFQGVVTSSASLFMIITIWSRIWVCPVFQVTLVEESVD